jgi:phage shock protein C
MPFSDSNVFARDDTFFGVCQAIADDIGFNANYLRIAFALPLLVAPLHTIAAYFGLAVIVLAIRLVVREPRRSAVTSAESPAVEAERSGAPSGEAEEAQVAIAA